MQRQNDKYKWQLYRSLARVQQEVISVFHFLANNVKTIIYGYTNQKTEQKHGKNMFS